jgi:hypothetical protein
MKTLDQLTREECVRLLESASIQCYEHETTETLREAVRVNLEDQTIPASALEDLP